MLDELIDNPSWLCMMSVIKRNLLYCQQDRKGEMHRLGSCINGGLASTNPPSPDGACVTECQRHNAIINLLPRHGQISMADVIAVFNISPTTTRSATSISRMKLASGARSAKALKPRRLYNPHGRRSIFTKPSI
ncbi:DeoR family transcriptional regulator [Serratia symbiotica]|uniref:DeoR family transcriptional regulator n=1 Tax=Serratia symbiotica TaxID=138074 RepID=UPI0030D3C703